MKKLIATFFIIVLFVSCQKTKNSTDIVAEKTNYLTAGVWHFTGYTYRNTISVVYYTDLPACRQDDLRIFNKDGTGELNEGPTKCNSSNPQSTNVQWNFVNGNTNFININGTEYIIYKLDNNTFDFSVHTTDPYAPETNYVFSR